MDFNQICAWEFQGQNLQAVQMRIYDEPEWASISRAPKNYYYRFFIAFHFVTEVKINFHR